MNSWTVEKTHNTALRVTFYNNRSWVRVLANISNYQSLFFLLQDTDGQTYLPKEAGKKMLDYLISKLRGYCSIFKDIFFHFLNLLQYL